MLDLKSAEQEQKMLSNLEQRWLAGSSTELSMMELPPRWQQMLKSVEAENLARASLAVWSRRQNFLKPAIPEFLTPTPPMPEIKLSVLPDSTRLLFRESLNENYSKRYTDILKFLKARGYRPHYQDWFPIDLSYRVSLEYVPLQLWCEEIVALAKFNRKPAQKGNFLKSFTPDKRLEFISLMNQVNPERALKLVLELFKSDSVNSRINILDFFALGKKKVDPALIDMGLNDSSWKVKNLAIGICQRFDVDVNPLTKKDLTLALTDCQDIAEHLLLKICPETGEEIMLLRQEKGKKQVGVCHSILWKLRYANIHLLASTLNLTAIEFVQKWSFERNHSYSDYLVDNLMRYASKDVIQALFLKLQKYSLESTRGGRLLQYLLGYRNDIEVVRSNVSTNSKSNCIDTYDNMFSSIELNRAFDEFKRKLNNPKEMNKRSILGPPSSRQIIREYSNYFALNGTVNDVRLFIDSFNEMEYEIDEYSLKQLHFNLALTFSDSLSGS